ncbi:hypothetical protein PR048_028109 [Dryococelus australis]|uniref:PiggyBac transposable element-derived protein domain-containing protein n=1 Tax=Dryococelus australis TaxID=614101 RepID=A0ABQ9GIB6_9NEOP|nr:hypothetical protein PR048_028109 [Dryococelus australis]
MRHFVEILLLSGYIDLPRKYMFWKTSADTFNQLVANALTRDRFKFIMGNIHVCDNYAIDKSSSTFSELNNPFLPNAPHYENHCVDETMVPYFGKHRCKLFIRGKPIHYGYKLWTGATKTEYKQMGLGASVVLQYVDILRTMGQFYFHISSDNFCTSIPLLSELRKRNFRGTGTIRESRLGNCSLKILTT